MTHQQEKFDRFAALHQGPAFVMPNAWDAGSARLLASLGFEALATTSAGYAFSKGKRDSFAALSREEILENAREIVTATDLPVSGDLEDGFGADPAACAQTICDAIDIGLVGGCIEDATGDAEAPIYPFTQAVERVAAAAEAKAAGPFLLTARAENWIYGRPDLDDTIRRLQAFCDAGADVVFAPGLPDLVTIKTVCDAVSKPVNVLVGLTGARYTVQELSDAGVRRISVGGSLMRRAMGALKEAALEMQTKGTFDYAALALPDADLAAMMSQDKITTRD